MLAIERKQYIVNRLKAEKKVYVSTLSKQLNVVEETIRRDLKELERKGIAMRSYGGAILKLDSNTLSFLERETTNYDLKKKIADLLNEQIEDGMILMIDTSTTAKTVAESLVNKKNITVITNSYKLINDLSSKSSIRFIGTGGDTLSHYQAFVGCDAIHTLKRYNADMAILGCIGLSKDKGFMETNSLEAELKAIMSEQSNQTVIVADHTKFDTQGKINMFSFSQVDLMVTDEKPHNEWLEFFNNKKFNVIYPE